jgi:hypothetical protein
VSTCNAYSLGRTGCSPSYPALHVDHDSSHANSSPQSVWDLETCIRSISSRMRFTRSVWPSVRECVRSWGRWKFRARMTSHPVNPDGYTDGLLGHALRHTRRYNLVRSMILPITGILDPGFRIVRSPAILIPLQFQSAYRIEATYQETW